MALKVNLSGKVHDLTIDNSHSAFEGTLLADEQFTVYGRTLAGVEAARLEKDAFKIQKRGKFEYDTEALNVNRFCSMVTDWEGFVEEDGTPIPCSPENKKALALNDRVLVKLILSAFDEETDNLRLAKKDELGNLKGHGNGS